MKTKRVSLPSFIPAVQEMAAASPFTERRRSPRRKFYSLGFIDGFPCFTEDISDLGVRVVTGAIREWPERVFLEIPPRQGAWGRVVWRKPKNGLVVMGIEFVPGLAPSGALPEERIA
ncbi:MAG TPA: PilZ domain-containing protein [Moorella mulderi]|nr:PilZ domain-containing protein [Moorella mulderi]